MRTLLFLPNTAVLSCSCKSLYTWISFFYMWYEIDFQGHFYYIYDTYKFLSYIWCAHVQLLSHVQLFVTPWTVVYQAPLSLGFPRQEYWSELPFPSPGALPNPGIEPTSPALTGRFFTTEPPGKPLCMVCICLYLYSNTF